VSEAAKTTRDYYVVVQPRGRVAYAATLDRTTAEGYARETGFPIEVWPATLERAASGFRFWDVHDPKRPPAPLDPPPPSA
jgi:hypothetical protein